jgi:hypothetical protein
MPNLRDDHLPPMGYITPVYPTIICCIVFIYLLVFSQIIVWKSRTKIEINIIVYFPLIFMVNKKAVGFYSKCATKYDSAVYAANFFQEIFIFLRKTREKWKNFFNNINNFQKLLF